MSPLPYVLAIFGILFVTIVIVLAVSVIRTTRRDRARARAQLGRYSSDYLRLLDPGSGTIDADGFTVRGTRRRRQVTVDLSGVSIGVVCAIDGSFEAELDALDPATVLTHPTSDAEIGFMDVESIRIDVLQAVDTQIRPLAFDYSLDVSLADGELTAFRGDWMPSADVLAAVLDLMVDYADALERAVGTSSALVAN